MNTPSNHKVIIEIFKAKIGKRVVKIVPHLGAGFIVSRRILDSVTNFTSHNNRVSTPLLPKHEQSLHYRERACIDYQANEKGTEWTDKLWEELSKTPEKLTIILLGILMPTSEKKENA